jgi:hypothetical protein
MDKNPPAHGVYNPDLANASARVRFEFRSQVVSERRIRHLDEKKDLVRSWMSPTNGRSIQHYIRLRLAVKI